MFKREKLESPVGDFSVEITLRILFKSMEIKPNRHDEKEEKNVGLQEGVTLQTARCKTGLPYQV